jgi:hypothetical protein
MKSFHAFWDQINGKMYENVPPPVKYDMGNYMDMTTSPLNGSEEGSTWALRPLTRDDTASHAADDVLDWQKKHGRNTTKLGDPMSDAEFAKFHGMTWGVGLLPGISTGR